MYFVLRLIDGGKFISESPAHMMSRAARLKADPNGVNMPPRMLCGADEIGAARRNGLRF